MDYIRTIVAGKKRRYKDNQYNLDLTYITPRLIAMSFPGEGFQKLYRNPGNSVSRFLHEKHPGKFQIFNLSNNTYDYSRYNNNVVEFAWLNHYPPTLELLFTACQGIHTWLNEDPENIAVIHCLAGKGRTGTLICCYLLFSGRFVQADDSLRYYRAKRFNEGGGVTQPSQVRYVQYFSQVMQGGYRYPLICQLSKVQFRTIPHLSNKGSRPYVEIYYKDQLIYTSQELSRDRQTKFSDDWNDISLHSIAIIQGEVLLQGDITAKVYHWGRWRFKKICRLSFNTAMHIPGQDFLLEKQDLDPDSFRNDKDSSIYFAINFLLKQICDCTADMEFDERCEICQETLLPEERESWDEINDIVDRNIKLNADPSFVLFGNEVDDVREVFATDMFNTII